MAACGRVTDFAFGAHELYCPATQPGSLNNVCMAHALHKICQKDPLRLAADQRVETEVALLCTEKVAHQVWQL